MHDRHKLSEHDKQFGSYEQFYEMHMLDLFVDESGHVSTHEYPYLYEFVLHCVHINCVKLMNVHYLQN